MRLHSAALAAVLLLSTVTPSAAQPVRKRFEIRLGSRTFTPPAAVPADLALRINTALTAANAERVHVLVQFRAPVSPAERRSLAARGITLLQTVDRETWFAAVRRPAADGLRGVPSIRWADLIRPEDRLAPDVRKIQPYQRRANGRVAYSVLFHKDVTAEEVRRMAERVGGTLEDFQPRAFPVVRTVTIAIPPAALDRLANEDIVARIEQAAPPDKDLNEVHAQPLSNVDDVQLAPFNLNGDGIHVGVWEAGSTVRATHLDLTPRVTVPADQAGGLDDHAAHVADTIGGTGINVDGAEGMAPAVEMTSFDSSGDANEMTTAADPDSADRISASNHSYGAVIGWDDGVFNDNQASFGRYTNSSVGFDNLIVATELIVMKSAGNDRNDEAADASGPADCTQGGFGVDADCIDAKGVAKNVITVGSVVDAGAISSFSSYGPTDDGRIKPDLVACGSGLKSLGAANDTATTTKSGTSMATPVVTGITALILQDAERRNVTLSAAAVKALLINTARDVNGTGQATVGPDYATGYGIADAQAAVNLLRQGGVRQDTLTDTGLGNAWTTTLFVPPGLGELKVTLAWSDPAGVPGGDILVNDLDLRLIAPDATVHTPWSLNPAAPGNAAVRNGGNDATNNAEQVSVLAPPSGTWTVRVSANAGNLPQAPQAFAVAGILPASDLVLVMDRSGSMLAGTDTPGVDKITALRNAANQMVDLLDLAGGHSIGLVQFQSNVVPFAPPFDLQQLTDVSRDAAHTAIDSIVANGGTNIISGVEAAISQLTAAAAPSPRQAIVVFSDGKHNTPLGSDLSSIAGPVQAGNYRFFSIGFGTDVDDAVLSDIASSNGGMHVNEQDLSPIQLAKHFLTVGALVHDLTVIADPAFDVGNGQPASLSTTLTKDDRSVIFAVNWTGKADDVTISLRGPQRCNVPMRDLGVRAGKTYRLIRLDLPYACNGAALHAGVWTLTATPKIAGAARETVDIMIVGDSRTKLDAKIDFDRARRQFRVVSRVLRDGKPAGKAADMDITAQLINPLPRTGDSARQDRDGKAEVRPNTKARRVKELRLTAPRADDRVVSAVVDASGLEPGLHQVRVVAFVGRDRVRREATLSFVVP